MPMQTVDLRPWRHAGSPFIPGECRFARPCSLLRWKTGRHGMLAIRSFLLGRRPVADDLHPQAPCPRIEGLLASHARGQSFALVGSVELLRMLIRAEHMPASEPLAIGAQSSGAPALGYADAAPTSASRSADAGADGSGLA